MHQLEEWLQKFGFCHQSPTIPLFCKEAAWSAAAADEDEAADEDDDPGDDAEEADHATSTNGSKLCLGGGAALALPGRSAALCEVVRVSFPWAAEGGLDFIGEDVFTLAHPTSLPGAAKDTIKAEQG